MKNLNAKKVLIPYPPPAPLTTIVLRLNEIRYCSIVARGSLDNLAYHSLPKY